MSSPATYISPVVSIKTETTGEISYPYHHISATNPIDDIASNITPQHTTSKQNFLHHYGYNTTPIAIYTMNFLDGQRIKGQPKIFHAQYQIQTTTTSTSTQDISIDGKVYTHKAFSNQQHAYEKNRYTLCMISPEICYTIYGIVDNEKKKQERLARELRIEGEIKCNQKKRRQVFKINDSAIMMLKNSSDNNEYPQYAFNTNATYTIVFYGKYQSSNNIIHTGINYIHNEHDIFVNIMASLVNIMASHGGTTMIQDVMKQEEISPKPTRKRRITSTTTKRKRRHSELTEISTSSPISPTQSITSSCISPVSTEDDVVVDCDMLSQQDVASLPITNITRQHFVIDKRIHVEPAYTPYVVNPYDSSLYPVGTSTTQVTSQPVPSLYPMNSPVITSLPSYSDIFSLDTNIMDPFTTSTTTIHDDTIPDMIPSLLTFPSLSSYPYEIHQHTNLSLYNAEMDQDTTNWLI